MMSKELREKYSPIVDYVEKKYPEISEEFLNGYLVGFDMATKAAVEVCKERLEQHPKK